jgi:hypothetical protein
VRGNRIVGLTGVACAFVLIFAARHGTRAEQSIAPNPKMAGLFEGHEDVGTVLHRGSVEYDAGKRLRPILRTRMRRCMATD